MINAKETSLARWFKQVNLVQLSALDKLCIASCLGIIGLFLALPIAPFKVFRLLCSLSNLAIPYGSQLYRKLSLDTRLGAILSTLLFSSLCGCTCGLVHLHYWKGDLLCYWVNFGFLYGMFGYSFWHCIDVTQCHAMMMKNRRDNSHECAICLEEFQGDDHRQVLPCEHTFHRDCFKQWHAINPSCPYCRLKISNREQLE